MTNGTPSPNSLLRAEAARRMLGGHIPRSTFNRMLHSGTIPGIRLGKRWYVYGSSVLSILNGGEAGLT